VTRRGPVWRHDRLIAYAPWVVIALAVGYFLLLACTYLDRPGLSYDETIFVPAALGGQYPQISYISARFDGVPTMIMPYIGALKSYLFAPIFAVFGVSVATIRGTAIALSAITLLLGYALGRQFLGKWGAVLLVLLMATSSSFIFMSKVDWGPIVLPMLLKVAVLIAFFRLLHTGSLRYLWAIGILSLLGMFNKQDFSWVIVAVTVGGVIVYGRRLWEILWARRVHTAGALIVLLAAGAALADKVILPNLGTSGDSSFQNPFPHLLSSWTLYQGILGDADLLGFFANHDQQPAWMAWSSILVAGALLFLLVMRWRGGALPAQAAIPARAAAFFFVVFMVMLFEIAATKLATGPHHVIELWPFQDAMLLASASAVLQTIEWRRTPHTPQSRRAGVPPVQLSWFAALSLVCAGLALCATTATQAVSTVELYSLMRQPDAIRPVVGADMFQIAGFIDANAPQVDEVVTANWGMGLQLFSLACPNWRGKVHDGLWWSVAGATPQTQSSILRTEMGDQRVLVIDINQQSQYDLLPRFRIDATTFQRAYAAMYPQRRPVTVLATRAYNVTYYGPPNDLTGKPFTDEGCSTRSAAGAATTAPVGGAATVGAAHSAATGTATGSGSATSAASAATSATVCMLTVTTCPTRRTMYCGSSARLGSLVMPLRLSSLIWY
jgi:hypothetical protein